MGLEYALLNRRDRTFFWLGKGPTGYSLLDTLEALEDQELLLWVLREGWELDKVDGFYTPDKENLEPWLAGIAERLHKFAKGVPITELRVVSDSGDEVYEARARKYRCVDSVYGADHAEFYNRPSRGTPDPWDTWFDEGQEKPA